MKHVKSHLMSSMTQQRTCWLSLKWNNNKYTQRFCYPKMYGTKLYGLTQKHHGFRILPFMQERSRIVHIFKCNPTQSFWIVAYLTSSDWVFTELSLTSHILFKGHLNCTSCRFKGNLHYLIHFTRNLFSDIFKLKNKNYIEV